jgi:hypothetical protein
MSYLLVRKVGIDMWRVLRSRRGESGAVAVEAALVVPVLMLLIFGMIEFAFVMRDYAGVSSLVRSGARTASTGADHGRATCETGAAAPPCSPGSAPALAQEAADTIQRSGSASNPDQIQYILVYKANNKGYPGADGITTMPTDCPANCVKFTWRAALDQFKYTSGTWDSQTISACFPGTPTAPMDRVGIYIRARHGMMTGLFGASIGISDRAVMNFEPLATATCNGKGPTMGGHQ